MLGEDAVKDKKKEEEEAAKKEEQAKVTWYHEGSDGLRAARFWIADYSLPR